MNKESRIFVSGANGLLGTNIIIELLIATISLFIFVSSTPLFLLLSYLDYFHFYKQEHLLSLNQFQYLMKIQTCVSPFKRLKLANNILLFIIYDSQKKTNINLNSYVICKIFLQWETV